MNRSVLFLLMASLPAWAEAPVVIDVDPAAAALVPAGALRAALDAELGGGVTLESSPAPPRGTLTLSVDEERRLVLVYRDAAGNEIHRTVTVPRTPAATLEMVALIAGNLIRNETDDLVGSLTPVIPPPPLAAPPAPPVIPPPPAAPPPSPAVAAQPPFVIKRPIDNRALAHRFTLGLEGFGSSNGRSYGFGGLSLAYTASAHIAAGINNFTWAQMYSVEAISAGPFVEAFWFPRRWLQPYGQLGLPLEVRWQGPTAGFSVAAYAGTGVRFWVSDRWSLGAAVRLMVVASNGFVVWNNDLPPGSVSFAGGLEVAAHL